MEALRKMRGRLAPTLVGLALALVSAPAAASASPGALARYVNGSRHWVTTGAVTSGYTLQDLLGFLSPNPAPGTTDPCRRRHHPRRRPS